MDTHFLGKSAQPRAACERLTGIAPAILLIAVAAACWVVTADRMQGMDMGPGTDLGGLGWFAVMWATMMAAMMLPSFVPMAVAYAGASPSRRASSATATASVFAGGYVLTWAAAGVLAYAVFQGIRSLDLSWLAWDQGGRYVAGAVIFGAALYELTPAKARCLGHCRNPELLTRRWRPGLPGALRVGLDHGGFCVGASWALMAALFALGVMSLTWMIVIAALVAIEKLLPSNTVTVGALVLFIAALGLAVAFAPGHVPGLTIPG
jgi:predicted metal-binding membrane protein